jgi:hypothetical protein
MLTVAAWLLFVQNMLDRARQRREALAARMVTDVTCCTRKRPVDAAVTSSNNENEAVDIEAGDGKINLWDARKVLCLGE